MPRVLVLQRKHSRAWIVPKTEDKNGFNVEENATESVKIVKRLIREKEGFPGAEKGMQLVDNRVSVSVLIFKLQSSESFWLHHLSASS